ncbi:MAG: tetratricopeptide repeat protein [Bacteroidales bacterium]|nr:tetratricopeptide repeat protein [Bacteroidales bacterium]MBP5518629.1 tetratricopeptide repeat protein [Bacteroidales bacterium]
MAKINKESSEPKANVAEALSKTEVFFEKNKKTIGYVAGGIIVVAALIYAWYSLIYQPKQREAVDQLFVAERYFRLDSFNLALNGDGNSLGFAQVIDKYGKKAGEAVFFDAGICCLRLGDYDKAIDYLKKYSTKDNIMKARAKAAIGDALVNKGDIAASVPYFEEAASISNNIFSAGYLQKAGICYEELGQLDKALAAYNKIKNEFPNSPEGMEVQKFISRVEASIK